MPEYELTEVTTSSDHEILALLQRVYPDLTASEVETALSHHYRLFALRKQAQWVGIAGLHIYPHLSDRQRAWIHDLITTDDPAFPNSQSELIANLRQICSELRCSEIAIHVSTENAIANQFFLKEAGQPFAVVYGWTKHSWTGERTAIADDVQCREIKTVEDIASSLSLLKHFHPDTDQTSLTNAMQQGYEVFGLWIEDQLCSIATLIRYPHLKNGICVWLQDGMTLPIKRYKEAASSLFQSVMNACFQSGSLTVTVHARATNRRIHRFYEQSGGHHIANAYKWKMDLA